MAFAGLKKQINKANQVQVRMVQCGTTLRTGMDYTIPVSYCHQIGSLLRFTGKEGVLSIGRIMYVTEKMGAAEGTKLDEDFCEMEKRTDITYELVEELQLKTKEFLQPNPNARAKMAAVKSISKLSGQAKAATYPQPEGVLGEAMVTFGRKLGDDNQF
ncbi:hypothetical protein QYM36_017010, partial [Artemia franciscana]